MIITVCDKCGDKAEYQTKEGIMFVLNNLVEFGQDIDKIIVATKITCKKCYTKNNNKETSDPYENWQYMRDRSTLLH